jgi:hypothetical protein
MSPLYNAAIPSSEVINSFDEIQNLMMCRIGKINPKVCPLEQKDQRLFITPALFIPITRWFSSMQQMPTYRTKKQAMIISSIL